jgi:hypothetical protein
VYLASVPRRDHALVDTRLYLPREWTGKRKRAAKAGVPSGVRFRTRHELALAMLDEPGPALPHGCVSGDDELGRCSWFRGELRGRGGALPAGRAVEHVGPGPGRRPARVRRLGAAPQSKVFTYQAVHRRRITDLARALPTDATRPADARKVIIRAVQRLAATRSGIIAGFGLETGTDSDWWVVFRRGVATQKARRCRASRTLCIRSKHIWPINVGSKSTDGPRRHGSPGGEGPAKSSRPTATSGMTMTPASRNAVFRRLAAE